MAQKLYWKAKFASEYRRNMLCHNNDLNLEGLTKHLQNKFGIKHGSTKVMYQDDENDWIMLGDDSDLQFALATNKQPIHFKITVDKDNHNKKADYTEQQDEFVPPINPYKQTAMVNNFLPPLLKAPTHPPHTNPQQGPPMGNPFCRQNTR